MKEKKKNRSKKSCVNQEMRRKKRGKKQTEPVQLYKQNAYESNKLTGKKPKYVLKMWSKRNWEEITLEIVAEITIE